MAHSKSLKLSGVQWVALSHFTCEAISSMTGTLAFILKGEESVRLTSSSFLVRIRLFWKWKKIHSFSWCSRFLTSKDKEVSRTDASPFFKGESSLLSQSKILLRRNRGPKFCIRSGTWWRLTSTSRWPRRSSRGTWLRQTKPKTGQTGFWRPLEITIVPSVKMLSMV